MSFTNTGLWKPFVQEVYCCHFSNSICSLLVSVTHFDKSSNISNLLLAKRLCKIILFCRLMIIYLENIMEYEGFPDSSLVKNLPANAGDMDLIPGSGRYPREGNGNPLLYSCLGNPMDRGAWWATVHGVANELNTT